jgi:phytoene dehydrogenase-like protein
VSWDAIVIGAGTSGLASAITLARGANKVLVLEGDSVAGGLCASRPIGMAGHRSAGLVPSVPLLDSAPVNSLGLAGHGLKFRTPAPILVRGAGADLLVPFDPARADELAAEDRAAYASLHNLMGTIRPLALRILSEPPPPIEESLAAWPALRMAFEARRLGHRTLLDLTRVGASSLYDELQERFAAPALQAALALAALRSSYMGPRAPTSTATLLLSRLLGEREVLGGPPALVAALLAASEQAEVTVRLGARVTQICVEGGRVVGVETEAGRESASRVVAAIAPDQALRGLVDPFCLPPEIEDASRQVRTRGTTAVMHLALSGAFEIDGRGAVECIQDAVDLNTLERCQDAVRRGELADRLALDVRVPTLPNPSLAPEGDSVVTVWARGAPAVMHDGWNQSSRAVLQERILHQLEELVPGVRGRIVATELFDPARLEAEHSLPGGHPAHAEVALDQLWLGRPARALCSQATGIEGLTLGSVGTHPGPASCVSGVLAAR